MPTASAAGLWSEADGTISAQSGGFTVVAAYPTLPNTATAPADNSLRANGNVYINAGEDLSDNGIVATIALQNTVDQNGDMITQDARPRPTPTRSSPVRSASAGATWARPRRHQPAPPTVRPAGAQNASSFAVSPRNSDGSVTADGTRKRFYVVITS